MLAVQRTEEHVRMLPRLCCPLLPSLLANSPQLFFYLYRAALYAAVVKGHRSATVRLVEAKANVNIPNHKRVTPLMTAKALGHDDIIRVLDQADAKSWVEFSEK